MQTRTIGKSKIKASVLSMGTWAVGGGSWWGENDDELSIKSIHSALDLGVNWVDSAPVYGFGHSEDVVGKAIKDRRDKVIISTKCGLQWYDEGGSKHFSRDGYNVYRDLSAKAIRRDLEHSLKRLKTDYIDVYYTHWQSVAQNFVPIEETMEELMKMKEEGYIRAIGASNVTIENLKEYTKYGQLDTIQEKYSILDKKIIDNGILNFCEDNDITVQTYSPIEQGLLTGKIKSDYVVKPGEVRENKKWWNDENRAIALEMLDKWEDLTDKYKCSIGNLVIKWTMLQSKNINVLCGARKTEHVLENFKAADIDLQPKDMERMTVDANEAFKRSK